MEIYDYIIVGGGTAGCVLANRLTACGQYDVLVLEAGGEPRSMWIDMPAGFSKLLTNERYNWRFHTEPEANTLNRVISVPRGKGLGGSTLINGMIFVRGQPGDYDAWADAGAAGWNYAQVEPYFRRMETFAGAGEGRGRTGPMSVVPVRERYPITQAFIEAGRNWGLPYNEDYNGGTQEGVGYYQATQRAGRRWSAYDAYLKPARRRKNLDILTGTHVLGLDIEGRECRGVRFQAGGQARKVRARRSVVLSAGALQSPQLLELSGIGRPEVLRGAGIEIRHVLNGVGENYIDHFCTRMNWRLKGISTLNEMSRDWRLGAALLHYLTRGRGFLTLGTGLVNGFVRTRPELATPDVQYFFMHASYANAAERMLDRKPGMTLGVSQMRPQSVGSIHVRSPDARDAPVIRPNFLASAVDQETLVAGMRIGRQIVETEPVRQYVVEEASPGGKVQTDAQWLEFARENGQTIYHPIGTCRMGEDEGAVVDSRLRVRGIGGLRVVDASVMPSMISGNVQAAVMMLAERGADLILQDAAQPA
ncbi:GMC family oxidoreductase [Cupriavidus sp. 30B13]|uniref:GMC family oxidoreductase n=1 Tax=Cupriavidus sp. 30B13 TaxID=3384241 RepID=UPI003B8F08E4